jgi:hypothetical protein
LFVGGSDLKGARVASIRGTDLLLNTPIDGSTIDYINGTEYEILIKSFKHLTIVHVPVFASIATVNFQSRSTQSLHFFAIYQTATNCPEQYLFNENIQQCQYVDVNNIHITTQTKVMKHVLFILYRRHVL